MTRPAMNGTVVPDLSDAGAIPRPLGTPDRDTGDKVVECSLDKGTGPAYRHDAVAAEAPV